MKEGIRDRIVFVVAAIPLAIVLSFVLRIMAEEFRISTPGLLFLQWYVPGYEGRFGLGGPALVDLLVIDFGACLLLVLCILWILQKWYTGDFDRKQT